MQSLVWWWRPETNPNWIEIKTEVILINSGIKSQNKLTQVANHRTDTIKNTNRVHVNEQKCRRIEDIETTAKDQKNG